MIVGKFSSSSKIESSLKSSRKKEADGSGVDGDVFFVFLCPT